MKSKSDSKISSYDEPLGPFGQAAISMLNALFPGMYRSIVVAHPSFSDSRTANVSPQFQRGDYYVVTAIEQPLNSKNFVSNLSCFSALQDPEDVLNHCRYEHAIFASNDLGILTAWAQAEFAIVAFKQSLVGEYEDWFKVMHEIDVLYEIG